MFELAAPWVLLLLCVPFVFFLLPALKDEGRLCALRIPFYGRLSAFLETQTLVLGAERRFWFFAFLWALLCLALAGPRYVGAPEPLTREGHHIMMVLDLSVSMDSNDMLLHGRPASRLSVVKAAASDFVRARREDKIGLILFGTKAYLQTPLTYDKHSVLMRIEDATTGLAGNATSLGDALGLAVKRLKETAAKDSLVILLTDGVNNSGVLAPLKAAELAEEAGIKVYTIGLGSEPDPGALMTAFFGDVVAAELDEKTLKEIAQKTGGRYFRASDGQSLQQVYQRIDRLEAVKEEGVVVRPQTDYYPYCLAALLFSLGLWLSPHFLKKRLRS